MSDPPPRTRAPLLPGNGAAYPADASPTGPWQAVVSGVDVASEADELAVHVTVEGGAEAVEARVAVRALDTADERVLRPSADGPVTASFRLSARGATRWSPAQPALHALLVDVAVSGRVVEVHRTRVGLRHVGTSNGLLTIDGVAMRLRGGSVGRLPGDAADRSERAACEELVRRAAALGLNALRVVGPAVAPELFEVCDEQGMLVALELPAGPAAPAVRAAAARHPSVVLVSSASDGAPVAAPSAAWAPVDTGGDPHGRLLLHTVTAGHGLADPAFEDEVWVGERDGARTTSGAWPGSAARLRRGTRGRQGRALRAGIEEARRAPGAGGFWLDPLLDGPGDARGVLDVAGAAKPETAEEVLDACQMLGPGLGAATVAEAGAALEARPWLVNDGPAVAGVELVVRLAGVEHVVTLGRVAAGAVVAGEPFELPTPAVPGAHTVDLRVRAAGRERARGRHDVHLVASSAPRDAVRVVGGGGTVEALAVAGVDVTARGVGPTVVAEDGLDAATGAIARLALAAGGTVLVLAQPPGAVAHLPVRAELLPVDAADASRILVSTDSGALPALPRRAVLDDAVAGGGPSAAYGRLGDATSPTTVVVAYVAPDGSGDDLTVVGAQAVGPGRLLVCQLRLTGGASGVGPGPRALLRDLVRWAAGPAHPVGVERGRKDDGRHITYYRLPGAPS